LSFSSSSGLQQQMNKPTDIDPLVIPAGPVPDLIR